MRKFKRMLSFVLSIAMVLSLAVPAFAEDTKMENTEVSTDVETIVEENKEIKEFEENEEEQEGYGIMLLSEDGGQTDDFASARELRNKDSATMLRYTLRSTLRGWFGDNSATVGYSTEENKGTPTNLSATGNVTLVNGGHYYAYKNSDPETAIPFIFRVYHEVTFQTIMPEEGCGKLLVNGEEIASGTKKEYNSGTVLAISTECAEGFMCSSQLEASYTVSQSTTLTAEFRKSDFATVTVNANAGGTVTVKSGSTTVTDGRIDAGAPFVVTVTPNKANGYYVKNVSFTCNGAEIEAEDNTVAAAAASGQYEVNVEFAKVTVSLADMDIRFADVDTKDWTAVKAAITAAATVTEPSDFTYTSIKVEYDSNNNNWTENFNTSDGGTFSAVHAFGKMQKGGTVAVGNTQRVRITYTGSGAYDGVIAMDTATATIIDGRDLSSGATVTLTVVNEEGGSAALTSKGSSVTDGKIVAGDPFTVVPSPNGANGYYVKNVRFLLNDVEITVENNTVPAAAANGEYTVEVEFGQITASLDDMNVNYADVFNGRWNAVKADILAAAAVDAPDDFEYASIKVEYDSNNNNWTDNFGTSDGGLFSSVHAFGKMQKGGEVAVGNTQRVRVTYIGSGSYSGVTAVKDAEATIVDGRNLENCATVTVNANAGGTVTVTSDNIAVTDGMVEAGASFAVAINPAKTDGYYVVSATCNGQEITAENNTFTAAANGEYVVAVEFAQITATLADVEVGYFDVLDGKWDEIKSIIASAERELNGPEDFTYTTSIEYQSSGSSWTDNFATQDGGLLSSVHAFGKTEKGGKVLPGNEQPVRIRYTGTGEYEGVAVTAQAVATIVDFRPTVSISGSTITVPVMTSRDAEAFREEILKALVIKDADGNKIEWAPSDIVEISPSTMGGSLLPQMVTVTYSNDTGAYARSSGSIRVNVQQIKASIDVKSQRITYGETPKMEIRTDPEGLDYISVLGGIDGNAQGFVTIDIPNSIKETMKFDVLGLLTIDLYDMIANIVNQSPGLSDVISGLQGLLNMEFFGISIKDIASGAGFDLNSVEEIMNVLGQIVDAVPFLNMKVALNAPPVNTGVYLFAAISTDSDYTLAMDVAYLTIAPQYSNGENKVSLKFNTNLENSHLSYTEAKNFDFGAAVFANDVDVTKGAEKSLHNTFTKRTGLLSVDNLDAPNGPGSYTQTALMLGGNYVALPISRSFSIDKQTVKIAASVDSLTLAYGEEFDYNVSVAVDEEAEAGENEILFSVVTESGEGLGEAVPTVRYVGRTRGANQNPSKAYNSEAVPTEAGNYKITVSYPGDAAHQAASAEVELIIAPKDVTITMGDAELVYGSEMEVEYIVSEEGIVSDIKPYVAKSSKYPHAGTHDITATYKASANINVIVVPGTLTVTPRPVTVTIRNASKMYADADPSRFSYTIEAFNAENESGRYALDSLNLPLPSRIKGENAGEYEITIQNADKANPDYTVTVVPAVFTILPRPVTVSVDNVQKDFGKKDPDRLTYTVEPFNAYKGTGIKWGDSLNLPQPVREPGEEKGKYAITLDASNGNPNYVIAVRDGVFTIAPHKVTVIVKNASKVYGQKDPVFTYEVQKEITWYGFLPVFTNPVQKGDDLRIIFVRQQGEAVGTYRINATAANEKYEVNVVPGTLTITQSSTASALSRLRR